LHQFFNNKGTIIKSLTDRGKNAAGKPQLKAPSIDIEGIP